MTPQSSPQLDLTAQTHQTKAGKEREGPKLDGAGKGKADGPKKVLTLQRS